MDYCAGGLAGRLGSSPGKGREGCRPRWEEKSGCDVSQLRPQVASWGGWGVFQSCPELEQSGQTFLFPH